MIKLTRLNDQELILNCEIIEYIEEVPHTVIKTVHDNKYVVKESAREVVRKVIEYKQKIISGNYAKGI